MRQDKIKEIIDIYLQKWIDMGLNTWPGRMEPEMADRNQDLKEEERIWHPINSKVTDGEIEEVERQICHKLPKDYKFFLQHKHFYELPIYEASFCRHPVNTWRQWLIKMIFD